MVHIIVLLTSQTDPKCFTISEVTVWMHCIHYIVYITEYCTFYVGEVLLW